MVSRLSLRLIASRAMKSGLVWPASASSEFAPIDVALSNSWSAILRDAGPPCQSFMHSFTMRQANTNARSVMIREARSHPDQESRRVNSKGSVRESTRTWQNLRPLAHLPSAISHQPSAIRHDPYVCAGKVLCHRARIAPKHEQLAERLPPLDEIFDGLIEQSEYMATMIARVWHGSTRPADAD